MAKTFYDIFEVSHNATSDEIRGAYRRLVQRHHPDKHRGNSSAEELLKAINYAYSILSDPRKRATYDARLAIGADPENEAGNVYVYTGEATVNGASGAQSRSRESETRTTAGGGLSQISKVNSWLALAMLALLFLAISRFFYQITAYTLSNALYSENEAGGGALFYGIMIGVVIAGAAVWLTGKMLAYILPLAWPLNLLFRERVRSDLSAEHRRMASGLLVAGIILTFAVPDLDRRDELTMRATITGEAASQLASVATIAQNQPKIAVPPVAGVVRDLPQTPPPVVLAQNMPPHNAAKPETALGAQLSAAAPTVTPRFAEIPQTSATAPGVALPPAAMQSKAAEQKTAKLPAPAPAAKQQVAPIVSLPPKPSVTEKKPLHVAPVAVAAVADKAQKKAIHTEVAAPALAALAHPRASQVLQDDPMNGGGRATPGAVAEVVSRERQPQPAPQNNAAPVEVNSPTLATHRKAAQQGAANSQYQLGRAYEKGQDDVLRDHQQAITWYRKAAEQGHGPAQYSLGSMYMLGKGVPMDPVEAYVWLSLAANNNVSSGQQVVEYLTSTLTPDQLADAKRRVAKWSPRRK